MGKTKVKIIKDELLKERSFLVYDTGLALDHAVGLGSRGNKVYYFTEYRTRYPKIEDYIAGYGFNEITKVLDYGTVLDKVDVILMVDVGFGNFNHALRRLGKSVFGSSPKGDMLELDRTFMLREFEKLGITVPRYKIVRGVDELLRNIVDGKKQFVKLNIFRGNLETTAVTSKKEMKIFLEEAKFGALEDDVEFIITDEVEGVEIGVDLFFNGDHFLKPYNFGNEVKGAGSQLNKVVDESIWDELLLNKIEPWLAESGYRGNISFEGIFNGSDIAVLDVTARLFFPGSAIYPRYLINYDDVIEAVANGEDITPRWEKRYTNEICVTREDSDKWTHVKVDAKIKEHVQFPRGAVKVKDEIWCCPGDKIVAVVLGAGNTFEESIADLEKCVDKIEARESNVGIDAIAKYRRDYLTKLKEYGIEW